MIPTNLKLSLEEVIDEFFYSSDAPDAQKLQAAIDAHPEYREELVDFASLWASYENTPDSSEEFSLSMVSEQSVSTLQSFVINRLHELDHSAKGAVPDKNAAKEALSKLAGNTLRKAAEAIGIFGSSALLQKILNNGIVNVPHRVLENLASYLRVSIEDLNGALMERGLGGVKSYKASDKPAMAQTETWSNAVKILPLTDEQKKALLALQDRE